ncbi:hypothetical protein B0H12DRAFT_1239371 [Mycena haematopus]|nr:hypothetical protein B0H12DRAFT_1239371 [Mycena haematopus]
MPSSGQSYAYVVGRWDYGTHAGAFARPGARPVQRGSDPCNGGPTRATGVRPVQRGSDPCNGGHWGAAPAVALDHRVLQQQPATQRHQQSGTSVAARCTFSRWVSNTAAAPLTLPPSLPLSRLLLLCLLCHLLLLCRLRILFRPRILFFRRFRLLLPRLAPPGSPPLLTGSTPCLGEGVTAAASCTDSTVPVAAAPAAGDECERGGAHCNACVAPAADTRPPMPRRARCGTDSASRLALHVEWVGASS